MKKEIIRTDSIWIEVKTLGSRTDCFYGIRGGTEIHGHAVLSGSEIIYQRDISGARLVVSGADLILSN